MALNINGRMKVKTLRADFLKEFGLTLRVYDGRSFADEDATLASIRKGDNKGGEFSPKRNTRVGNLEDKILEMFGIKTKISGSDDKYLFNKELTLAAAKEEDDKRIERKEKKTNKSENEDETTFDFDNSVKIEDNDVLSLNELLDEIKSVYKGNASLDEMIEDINLGMTYINYWAEKFVSPEYNENKTLAKRLFKYAISHEVDGPTLKDIASNVANDNFFGDKSWAKEIFKLAIEKAETFENYQSLADDIASDDILGDKEWAKELYKKALERTEMPFQRFYISASISENLTDADWAIEVGQDAIDDENATPDGYLEMVRSILRGNDLFIDQLENLYQKIFDAAYDESCVPIALSELFDNCLSMPENKEWIEKIATYIEEVSSEDTIVCARRLSELASSLDDKDEFEWAKRLYEKALDCFDSDEYELFDIVQSIPSQVAEQNSEWKKEIQEKVMKLYEDIESGDEDIKDEIIEYFTS